MKTNDFTLGQTGSEKVKIGVFVQCFPVPSETFIVTKVAGLIKMGYDVKIFTNRKSAFWNHYKTLEVESLKRRVVLSPVAWYDHKFSFLFNFLRIFIKKICTHPVAVWRLWWHVFGVRKTIKIRPLTQFVNKLVFAGEKIDILHIEFDFQAYPLSDLKHYLKCKLVLSGRGSINRTSVVKRYPNFYSVIYGYVDHYHFISEYLYAEARKVGLHESTPISLIEPAIDLTLFKPKVRRKNNSLPVCLITTARLSWAKGYEFSIDAVALVYKHHLNVKYLILGSGDYEEAIRFAANQHGLLENGVVEFIGNVRREDVPLYLQNVDMMIHPALEEGFCNAVIEGQAMGLPVVCSDAGGLPENVEDGVTGWVVPRRDSRAMADEILSLIQNPGIRDEMGARGRERVLKKFNIKDQIIKFHQMYQSVTKTNI